MIWREVPIPAALRLHCSNSVKMVDSVLGLHWSHVILEIGEKNTNLALAQVFGQMLPHGTGVFVLF